MKRPFREIYLRPALLISGRTDLRFTEIIFQNATVHVRPVRKQNGAEAELITAGIMKKRNQRCV
jgi:hypothetical protein